MVIKYSYTMKTYAISLKRALQRREYIQNHLKELKLNFEIIDAVDGQQLTQEDLEANCDMEEVNAKRNWLSNGALACGMSHYKVFEKIVENKEPYALIVEDDAALPQNINEILEKVTPHLRKSEVLMLYYVSFDTCLLSRQDAISLGNEHSLCFPLNPHQPICTAAYIITYEAAKSLLGFLKPFRVTPDAFGYMFDGGAFETMRILYPQTVKVKNFKSTIDYQGGGSFTKLLSTFVDKYKVPLLYQLFYYRREKSQDKMRLNFALTDQKSPIAR